MPMPRPAVGGMPTSRAAMKSSSRYWASSSPASRRAAWASKRSRWSMGSFSSEKALPTSRQAMKGWNRSVRAGLPRFFLASGEISMG